MHRPASVYKSLLLGVQFALGGFDFHQVHCLLDADEKVAGAIQAEDAAAHVFKDRDDCGLVCIAFRIVFPERHETPVRLSALNGAAVETRQWEQHRLF